MSDSDKMTHVDDWVGRVHNATDAEKYAKFFFLLARLPASMKYAFHEFTKKFELYCTYEGKRYRVTGASRLGDVWLASDFERTTGYDLRVDLAKCSEWGASRE